MTVIIGVDPHKASHTAVAIGHDEGELGRTRVRATRKQVPQLLAWAQPLGARRWAIESAGGLGYLLAQQLVEAGEVVLDVPATLASRIRVLGNGRSDKNDPNDALSVAIAALRTPTLGKVRPADHAEVLRLLAKRNIDIGNHRTREDDWGSLCLTAGGGKAMSAGAGMATFSNRLACQFGRQVCFGGRDRFSVEADRLGTPRPRHGVLPDGLDVGRRASLIGTGHPGGVRWPSRTSW